MMQLIDGQLAPLTPKALKGRRVMIPREQWSEENCEEFGGQGWLGTVKKVNRQQKKVGVWQDGALHWFSLAEVLSWAPLP